MRVKLVVALLLILFTVGAAGATTITIHPASGVMKYLLNNATVLQGAKVPIKLMGTNYGIAQPVNESVLKNSKALIVLHKLYKISGAGYALFDKNGYLVLTTSTSARSPLAYCPQTNLFAATAPCTIFDPTTGKTSRLYVGSGWCKIFTVKDGKPVVLASVNIGSTVFVEAGVVLTTNTLIVQPNYITLRIYHLYYAPNGTLDITEVTKYNSTYFGKEFCKYIGMNESPYPYFDDIFALPSNYIAITGRFTSFKGNITVGYQPPLGNITINNSWIQTSNYAHDVGGDLAVIDSSGSLTSATPITETKIFDADVLAYLPDGLALFTNQYTNNAYFTNGGGGLGSPMLTVSKGSSGAYGPAVTYTWPEYMAAAATSDGNYVFVYKSRTTFAGSTTAKVALEVWSGSGQLLKVIFNNTTDTLPPGVGVTQPRSPQSVGTVGQVELIPFPDGLVIYNLENHEYRVVGFNFNTTGRLAAVSPNGQYVVMGDSLYELDYYLNIPAIEYTGTTTIYNSANAVNLNNTTVFEPPNQQMLNSGCFILLKSGKIKITSIFSRKRVENIITNTNVRNGLLWNMYKEGLIKTFVSTDVNSGHITNQAVEEGYVNGQKNPHAIWYKRTVELHPWAPYIAEGHVGSAVDLFLPVKKGLPVAATSNINLHYSLTYATVIPAYVQQQIQGLMLQEFGVGVGAGLAGGIAYKLLAREAPDVLTTTGTTSVYEAASSTASVALSKAAGVVGIGMIADGIYGWYASSGIYQNAELHTLLIVAPTFYSPETHQYYTVVTVFLPRKADQNKWCKFVSDLLSKAGIQNYQINVKVFGEDWSDYQALLAHTTKNDLQKTIDLQESISELANNYRVDISTLKLVGVHIFIDSIASGSVSLWQWITGLKFDEYTAVVSPGGFSAISVVPARVFTDPNKIANVLNPIYVNGFPVNLSPSADGAVASFVLPAKTQYVTVTAKKPYYATMSLTVSGEVIAPLHNDKYGIYETNFTYPWKYYFNESRIFFIGMPYKMWRAYETVYTTHGNEPVNMTPYMSYMFCLKDPTSPTGVRYYYGTTTEKDLRLIDPHNAGLMDPGKHYWIQYIYAPVSQLGDVVLHVSFNGTTLSSTLPRHARVILTNNYIEPQTVSGIVNVSVWYEDPHTHKQYMVEYHEENFTMDLPPNGTVWREWNIQEYIGKAISLYSQGKIGFVRFAAKITHAEHDIDKTNDYDSVDYYPPSSLTKKKPAILTVKVVNSLTDTGIPNATVEFSDNQNLVPHTTYTTNATGYVSIATTTGLHYLQASATGYLLSGPTPVYVWGNMTKYLYLNPANSYVIVPTPNGTKWYNRTTNGTGTPPGAPKLNKSINQTTHPILYINNTYYFPLEVLVQYQDGMPFAGANVTVYNATTGALVRSMKTDGTGYAVIYLPWHYTANVTVSVPSENYTSWQKVKMDSPQLLTFTISVNSTYFEPEVAYDSIYLWIFRGMGDVAMGSVKKAVYHSVDSVFYTNVPQTITFEIQLKDVSTGNILVSREFTVTLHKGVQKVREFIPVNFSNFTTCQVIGKIISYQEDTNPYNNYAVGNVVTFTPWIDIYPTIIWYPVKQKISDAVLPGDKVRVCIGVHVPKDIPLHNIKVDYCVKEPMISEGKMKVAVSGMHDFTSYGHVSVIWYNYTLTVPWTNKIVVNASVNNTYDASPVNNNVSAVIPISPDVACSAVAVKSLAVTSKATVPVTVDVKGNTVGSTVTVTVIDETMHNATLAIKTFNLTKPEETVTFAVVAPKVTKYYDTHTWLIYVTTSGDVYPQDGYKEVTVTIYGVPSYLLIGLVFLFVLIVLLIIKHLLTITPPREGKYFRKLNSTGGGAKGALTKDRDIGKYFRRLK